MGEARKKNAENDIARDNGGRDGGRVAASVSLTYEAKTNLGSR